MMTLEKHIGEVRTVENLEEVNQLLSAGWALLETGTKIVNDKTEFFFLVGATNRVILDRMMKEEEAKQPEAKEI